MKSLLPPELISEIIEFLLETQPQNQDIPGCNTKASWIHIDGFSRACHGFRLLSLSRWFRTLYLRSWSDMEDIDRYFPLLKGWCRRLHCVQVPEASDSKPWNLAGFKCLSYLRVDWLSSRTASISFINVESKITELDIRGLRHPSPMAIHTLTAPFVDVRTLTLDCMRIWCGLCNTTTFVRFPSPNPEGSPSSFVYDGGLGLPHHYASFLSQLENLEEVSIRLPDIGPRLFSAGLSAKVNENLWTGECDQCMQWLYEDEQFRKNWVTKKMGVLPPDSTSDQDKRSVYQRPPRLKKVRWSFWRLDSSVKDMPYSLDEMLSDEDYFSDGDY